MFSFVNEKLHLTPSACGLNTKDPLVYCSISMKCPEKAKLQTATGLVVVWGGGLEMCSAAARPEGFYEGNGDNPKLS